MLIQYLKYFLTDFILDDGLILRNIFGYKSNGAFQKLSHLLSALQVAILFQYVLVKRKKQPPIFLSKIFNSK